MADTQLRSYECNVRGRAWQRTINATSRGKARADYHRDVREAWPDIPFTAITCRVVGGPHSDDSFRHVAEYRGVPFARVGMTVYVGGDRGLLAGSNSSANFNVAFLEGKYAGQTLNCHPNHDIRYVDDDGNTLADFTRKDANG